MGKDCKTNHIDKINNIDNLIEDIVNISVIYIRGILEWNGEFLNIHKERLSENLKNEIIKYIK